MKYLSFLVFGVIVIEFATAFKRPPGSKCKEFFPVDVDDNWFFKFAMEGMDNPMGTRYSLKQGINAPPLPAQDTSLKNKLCMTADFKILIQTIALTVVFRYNRINEFKAFVQTEGTPAEKAFRLYGDFVMAKTDNRTYVLFFGCIFESQEFWQVHSPSGTQLSKKSRGDILNQLKANGFSTKEDDISSSKDPIWLESATVSDCSSKTGIAGTLSTLPKPSSKKGSSSPTDPAGLLSILTGFLGLG